MGRNWLTPVLTGCVGMAMLFAARLAPVEGGSQVAVLFPPWQSEEEVLRVVAATGATIVRPGGMASIWIMDAAPGSATRLALQDAAWAVLDAKAFGVCAVINDVSGGS